MCTRTSCSARSTSRSSRSPSASSCSRPVGVVLFGAGLRVWLGEVDPAVRKAVVRLVIGGAALTWLAITAATAVLYRDMDLGVAFLVGAILVVSGPAVVLPLLAFIRPAGA